ncbi:hypothetical protein [Arboricoccus pini]|uniref:hypothetical protein n=1 Tax=Arboricoccus pini TaxID=1963835 RepID=UPI001A9C30A0|nr:hypothetical protein [Arboricoccus pini]
MTFACKNGQPASRRAGWRPVFLTLALMTIPLVGASAQPATDPDWPCAQRLVPELSAATLWQGPELPTTPPPADDATTDLAERLIDRSLPMDKATELVNETVSGTAAAERRAKMEGLFLAVIDVANRQRSGMIEGIRNFGRRQHALADRINNESRQIRDLEAQGTDAASDDLPGLREQHLWDLRIFDERQHTVRLACDEPVQVEQRSFALGRVIASTLKEQGQ